MMPMMSIYGIRTNNVHTPCKGRSCIGPRAEAGGPVRLGLTALAQGRLQVLPYTEVAQTADEYSGGASG